MTPLALDTSVAIALLVSTHRAHAAVSRWWGGGGAVYDALVALAALEHGADLATRDARAKATSDAVGVRVLVAE